MSASMCVFMCGSMCGSMWECDDPVHPESCLPRGLGKCGRHSVPNTGMCCGDCVRVRHDFLNTNQRSATRILSFGKQITAPPSKERKEPVVHQQHRLAKIRDTECHDRQPVGMLAVGQNDEKFEVLKPVCGPGVSQTYLGGHRVVGMRVACNCRFLGTAQGLLRFGAK